MTTLSEKSAVSIGLVLVIIAGVVWAVRLEGKVNAAEEKLDFLQSVDRRLSRIEGALGVAPTKGEE